MRYSVLSALAGVLLSGAVHAGEIVRSDYLAIFVPLEARAQVERIATKAPRHVPLFAGSVPIRLPYEGAPYQVAFSSVLDIGPELARRLMAETAEYRMLDESMAAFGERRLEGLELDSRRIEA